MVATNCLYLKNLPRRPRSNVNFIRSLLSQINPDNKYVADPSLPLPVNETIGNAPLRCLDEKFGILEVSRSVKLPHQCFITFLDDDWTKSFMSHFGEGWKVHGRSVELQYADKNSLMGLAIKDQQLLHHVLSRRSLQRKIAADEDLLLHRKLARKTRRLRSKLRGRGLSDEEVNKITENVRSREPQQFKPKVKQPSVKPIIMRENPPNKILLVQNLPHDTTLSSVTDLFQSPALVEIRLVMVRKLAFVEYQSVEGATTMRNKLGPTYSWNDHQINIEFAK